MDTKHSDMCRFLLCDVKTKHGGKSFGEIMLHKIATATPTELARMRDINGNVVVDEIHHPDGRVLQYLWSESKGLRMDYADSPLFEEDELTAASNPAVDLVNAGKLDEAEKAVPCSNDPASEANNAPTLRPLAEQ
jgi:hypothetical protein